MAGEAAEMLFRLHQEEQRLGVLEATADRHRRVLEGVAGAVDPRPRLLRAESDRRGIALRLAEAEHDDETGRARARSHERQLYSGTISSPKELSQLATELENLRSRLAGEEDKQLELLAALDDADLELKAALAEANEARQDLVACQSDLEACQLEIRRRRSEISGQALHLYDRVATYRQPPPVVEVRNGVCGGCRLPLSITQARQLRSAPDPLVCETCGRILVLR